MYITEATLKAFFAVFLILPILDLQGQMQVMTQPLGYVSPQGHVFGKDVSRLNCRQYRSLWVVYSDRSNNLTYDSPKEEIPHKELGFMEAYYVVNETNTHIRLIKYKPDIVNGRNCELLQAHEDYGWISKDKMLLWSSSLLNDRGFTLKALPFEELEEVQNRIRFQRTYKELKAHRDPTSALNINNSQKVPSEYFFFVFKKEGNAYLIGKSERHSIIPKIQDNILGWVSSDKIKIWDQRLVIEPSRNLPQGDNGELFYSSVFGDRRNAMAYLEGRPVDMKNVLWAKKTGGERMPPKWMRLPVLGFLNDGLVKVLIPSSYLI